MNIKYVSLHASGGYGVAAKMYMKWLVKSGVNVSWSPMIPGSGLGLGYEPYHGKEIDDPELSAICNIDLPYDLVIVHTVPEYFPYWKMQESGKKIIGMTVWETETIPDHWQHLLNLVDALIVPTPWNQKVFERCGVTVPIDVVAHISEFHGMRNDRLEGATSPFVFYSISDWTNRKSPAFTVDAFLKAFSEHDAVKLILKTSCFDYTSRRGFTLPGMKKFRSVRRELNKKLRSFSRAPEIELIDRTVGHQKIMALHQDADCYVSLCRAEGWALPAYEAGWYAKPVVMTGFGGHTHYLKPENSYPVNFKMTPVIDPMGEGSYTPNQHWAEPDVGHAAKMLRRIYSDPAAARAKGVELKKFLVQNFSAESVTTHLSQILEAHLGQA